MSFKEECVALRKQDKSIYEIMRITGRSKTSVYYHIKNLPLSAARIQHIRTKAGERIRSYAIARKGKSIRTFRRFRSWSPGSVLLVSHLFFDGTLARGGCDYNNRSVPLIRRVEKLMERIYDFEPRRYKNLATGVHRISYYNVALGAYLRAKSRHLLQEAHNLPARSKREFLRAFFDDEGCMDFRPAENRRQIRGYQKDVRVLRIVRRLLADIGIESRIARPNEVIISGKMNLRRFEKEIGFSKGVYMNGNRANSRWKKHVEKRALLRLAIVSYRS